MLIVRSVFIAKPGNASKLAKLFKEVGSAAGFTNARVMTDLTGDFNRVVLEYEVGSMAEFEAQMSDRATNEKVRSAMQGYTEMFQTGYREILQVM